MDMSLQPEVLLRRDAAAERQTPLPLASEGVQRWVWECRYGAMLIEVRGDEVYVNGERVERHVP
jgi:hypothetical protein